MNIWSHKVRVRYAEFRRFRQFSHCFSVASEPESLFRITSNEQLTNSNLQASGQMLLRHFDKFGEGLGIVDGDFRKGFAVECDQGTLQPVNEHGVTDAAHSTGGGIVWDSDAAGEWQETQLKASRLLAAAGAYEVAPTLAGANQ